MNRQLPDVITSREAYLEAVIDLQQELVCRFLPDTTLTFVNRAYSRAFGLSKEKLIGRKFLEFIPESTHEDILASISSLNSQKTYQKYTHEVIIPGGEIAWQEWTDYVILDENNQVIEIQSTGRDITEQIKVEREKEYQKKLQQLIMEISSTYVNIPLEDFDKIVHKSLQDLGEFCDADRVYIFDYNYESEIVCNTYEWCRQGIEPQIQNLQNVPFSDTHEWLEIHNRGETIIIPDLNELPDDYPVLELLQSQGIISLLVVPIMNGKQCIGFVGLDYVTRERKFDQLEEKLLRLFSELLLNIKNRVAAQNSLMERERFLADIINKSNSLIVVKSAEGTYQLVNEKWSEVYGYTADEVAGKFDAELFPQHISQQFEKSHKHVLATGNTHEYEVIANDGSTLKYFLSTAFPIRDNKGNINGICSIGMDITDRKRADEEKLALTRAQAASQGKSTFLKNISRDIRPPLNTIVSVSQALKQNGEPQIENEQIQSLQRSSRQLMSLINNILDFSKLETDTLTLVISNFSLREVLDDIVTMFSERVQKKNIDLHLQIKDNVPDMVRSDESRIRQILVNVVGNAVKYTKEGSVTINVTSKRNLQRKLKPQTKFEYLLHIDVIDTGKGISEHVINGLFSAFSQNRSEKEEQGAGLGLAITKALIQKIGGEINVTSELKKGSCFSLKIPVNKPLSSPA